MSVGITCFIQLSDRLVSLGSDPYDPTANKTVVYIARDACVSIGYTGLAYLDGRPTDEWIAEKLIGEEVESRQGPDGGIAQRIIAGPMPRWFDIGTARQVLRRELVAIASRLGPAHRRHLPQLFIAGWQIGRRIQGDKALYRPMAHRIADIGSGPFYQDCWSASHDGWRQGNVHVEYTPTQPTRRRERADLRAFLEHRPDPDAAEARMAAVLHL